MLINLNYTAGNSGTISVTIIKDTSTNPPPGMPGYNLPFLVSVISILLVILIT